MSQRPPMLPDVLSATTSSALLNLGADSIGHHSRMRAITARVGALLHPAAARSSERADSLNCPSPKHRPDCPTRLGASEIGGQDAEPGWR
jgi:hypothetical protein